MTNAGPIVVDDPTKVLVRRIIAYGIDLVVTLALTAALGAGIFMATSVEGTTTNTASGSKITSDSPAIRGCDANQTIVEKVRVKNRTGGVRSHRRRFRNQTVQGEPDFCVAFSDGSVRYIKQGQTFKRWLFWSAITASALNLVLLQGLVGASVGKLLLGLRVVRQDGSRLPLGGSLWRWVLLALDSMCCFMPGVILVFKNPGHQRLGDLGTNSFVVRQSAAGQPIQVPGID